MGNRNEEGRRYRNARNDSSVGSMEKRIEHDYGMPEGSISIRNSDGSNARSDKKIHSVRNDYNNRKEKNE